jgi:threonine synthase
VGYAVARKAEASASPMVTLATAHPAKFPDAVETASGIRPGLPQRLGHLMAAKERYTVLPNDVGHVRDFILSLQQA